MISIVRSAGIIFIISIVLGLIMPCQASNINIDGNITPISGKEDANFLYSAVIKFPGGSTKNPDINGALIINLKISDDRVTKSFYDIGKFQGGGLSPDELIRGESNPFTFGPYNLGHLGLKNIDEFSYEFVLTTISGKELVRNKYLGPEIVIPPEFRSIQYSKTPYYYFQEFPITLTFKDKPNVIPSLQLSFQGPLNSSEETSWTEDLAAKATDTIYTFSKVIDLTQFRKGGNFSFNFTYNDFRDNEGYAPITKGPYYFTILPYSPKIVEPIGLPKLIEYSNFSLSALVEDVGMVLMGDPVGSSASLIINHPIKGEMTFNNSRPTPQDKYLVFEWDKSAVLFEKSDVLLSRQKPFQARLRYWNDNRKYGANSSNYSFVLINVTPLLTETHEPLLHMSGSETALEKIRAYVTYAKGMGDLKIGVTGPGGRYENILKGSPAGVNKYQYDWNLPFNRSQAGNYTLSFAYIHDSLEGGSYEFEQKPEHSFQVVPIFIEFQNESVSPPRGKWNSSYSYTVEVNSSVEADAILQIFNPCSSEWVDAGDINRIKPGKPNIISWMIQPFAYDCDELKASKYRFRANSHGKDFPSTIAYAGPKIINDEVGLLSLEYSSTVYVSVGSPSEQIIRATIRSPMESGQLRLALLGPEMNFNKTCQGTALGDDRYQCEWKIPFNDSHANHNYTLSLGYQHPDLEAEYHLGERTVQVKSVWISFGKAEVAPGAGRWNDTYLYSIPLNSSVETELALEVNDPCRYEWVTQARVKAPSGSGIINITATPFLDRCPEAEGKEAQYRLAASFGKERYESRVYPGPLIRREDVTVTLVALDYQPVLHVSKDRAAYQVVRATVDSSLEGAKMSLSIEGPGKSFEEQSYGSFLGGIRYVYTWSVPFTLENAGNHTISLRYNHSKKKMSFPEQIMSVSEEQENGQPQLLSLDYSPIIYVEGDKATWQNITAEVFSPVRKGMLRLDILGPDKNETKIVVGEDKGENIYLYRWSQPFDASNAGKNYRITASYLLAGNVYAFNDRIMSVVRKDGTPPQIWEPTLGLEYDRTVFVPVGGKADQVIRATINYSQGMGRLRLNLTGPGANISDIKDGQNARDGRHLYTWVLPFADDSVGNEYKISLTYIHPTLPGGEYRFADRGMRVSAFEDGQIKFNNASVTPSHGSGLTRYTYCVDIATQLQEADIQLAIAGPNYSTFAPQHIVHYDGSNKTLCWPDMAINSNKGGNASFKFLSHASNSRAYPGPRIEAINASGSVQPAIGVLQGFQIDDDFYSFTYTAHIKNMSEDLMPWIELMVRPPNSGWRTVGNKLEYDPAKGSISWTEKPFVNESFFGVAEFKFKIDGLDTQTFRGPEIAVIYDEPSWTKTGTKYSYWAWFNATENLTIDLLYSEDGQRWTTAKKPQDYAANSGRTKKTWPEQDGHNEFEFDIKIRKEGGAA